MSREWLERTRLVAVTGLLGLRSAPLHTLLVSTFAVGALTVLAPVEALHDGDAASGSALDLARLPGAEGALRWTATAEVPNEVRARTVGELLGLLQIAAWGAAVVAGATILSLALAHALSRREEIGIRRAAGASRTDLILAFLLEGSVTVLAVVAGGAAVSTAALGIAWRAWPGLSQPLPGLEAAPFLVVAGVLAAGALASAWQTRRRRVTLESGRPTLFLPAAQLGVSLATLTASVLVLERASATGGGTDAASPHLAQSGWLFALDLRGQPSGERSREYTEVLSRLELTPGVEIASLTSPGLVTGLGTTDALMTDCGRCPDRGGILLPWRPLYASYQFVSRDSFAALGYKIIAGRGFTASDGWDSEPVAVVNRYLALGHFEHGAAVGRRLLVQGDFGIAPYRVVGIVDDNRLRGPGRGAEPLEVVYLSMIQNPPVRAELLVRTAGADSTGAAAAAALQAAGAPPGRLRVMPAPRRVADVLADASAPFRWFGRGFRIVGWVTLALALAGTFAALGRWVRAIAPEIALRRAVGATRTRLMVTLLGQALAVAGAGTLIGIVVYVAILGPPLSQAIAGLPTWAPALTARLAIAFALAALAGAALPTVAILRAMPASLLGPR